MDTSPPPSPAERFAALLRWLSEAAAGRSCWDRLAFPWFAPIIDRLREIKQCINRIAARVQAGRYAPRHVAPRRVATGRRTPPRHDPAGKRPPDKLPRDFGWLIRLLPEIRGGVTHLEQMLCDPEILALLEAAPSSLRRPVRSLCRMLRVKPPAILAFPPRTPKPPPPREAPPAPAPATTRPAPRPSRAAAPIPKSPPPSRRRAPPRTA